MSEGTSNHSEYVTVNEHDVVTTLVRSKQEIVEIDIDMDMAIPCRLCSKVFANPIALRNHARVLHMGEVVDVDEWLQDVPMPHPSSKVIKMEPKDPEQLAEGPMDRRTGEVVASMKPFDMATLISGDVQYVIVKAEDFGNGVIPMKRKEPREKKREREAKEKQIKLKEAANTTPITGPFECLQPSGISSKICHRIFFSCCEYSAHFRDEHTRRRKSQRCQVCEKLLNTPDGQEVEFPYMCQVCGVGFELHADLATHTAQAHVKLKPYQCEHCLKRFTQQGGLHQHLRAHNGQRPFPCSFCNKAFTQKSGLDQHLRIHTKVKPYRCVICQKSFCQSVHLKQHMRTHTNVTPFQCAICEKKFKQSSHLNYHLKNHTEANMTFEQNKKYQELMGLLKKQQENTIVVTSENEEVSENVVVEDRGYILSDNGDETWTVMVDEGSEECVVLGE